MCQCLAQDEKADNLGNSLTDYSGAENEQEDNSSRTMDAKDTKRTSS